VHPTDEVRNLLTLEHGILALSPSSLRSQIRRGIPCFTHTSENMQVILILQFLINKVAGTSCSKPRSNKLDTRDVGMTCNPGAGS
jgi:hypothetical protein